MILSRRSFLAATAAVGAATTLPAVAAPKAPAPVPVPGPLADAYGSFGAPRGRALGLSARGQGARTVTWLTTGPVTGPVVQWGVIPPGAKAKDVASGRFLTRTATATSTAAPAGRFEDDDGTSQPIDGEHPVFVHRSELDALAPGTTVGYRVGDGRQWSAVSTFVPRAADAPSVLAHFGDHGINVASRRTTAAVAARRPDALVLTGDISYANGFQPQWDRWANQAEPFTSTTALLPAPGNHEAKDYYGETYRTRFATPGTGGRNWYTTDLGRAHLFVGTAGCFLTDKDPTTARDLVVDELVGLERSLAQAAVRRAAGEIDFIVVAQHFPLFTNHDTRGPFSPELVVAQEHVLQRYQVDMVLVGHDHMYQRSVPMAYGERTGTAAGYVQICAGAGGNGLYDFADPDGPDWGDWCEAFSRTFSFAEYRIETGRITGTVRSWDDAEARATDPNPNAVDPLLPATVIDTFTLARKDETLVASAAAALPRSPLEIVAGVPEAHGRVVRNAAEDCTNHH